jgi:hypothetical protein
MNLFGLGRWLEWIGVRASRTKTAAQHALDMGWHALAMGDAMIATNRVMAQRIANVETLLRQQNERQEQVMTLIQQVKDLVVLVLSKEATIEAKDDAVINLLKASQSKITQLEGLLADAVAKLQAGDAGSIEQDLTGIQGQLQLLNASLDTDAGKLDAALADPPSDAPAPPADTTTPPAPAETTVDTTPAIDPAPASEPAPAEPTPSEAPAPAEAAPVTEATAPSTDAPVAPTEG